MLKWVTPRWPAAAWRSDATVEVAVQRAYRQGTIRSDGGITASEGREEYEYATENEENDGTGCPGLSVHGALHEGLAANCTFKSRNKSTWANTQ